MTVQLGLGFLDDLPAGPPRHRQAGPPSAPAVQAGLAALLDAIVAMLPGFACVNVGECGNAAPGWNPEHGIPIDRRQLGIRLLCRACHGIDDYFQPEAWVPPRLMRRAGPGVLYGWDPATGELVGPVPAWEPVEAWSARLLADEGWARYGRFQQRPRPVLTEHGVQQWGP